MTLQTSGFKRHACACLLVEVIVPLRPLNRKNVTATLRYK